MTARDTVRDRIKGLDAGADDYLVKPFDLTNSLRGSVPRRRAAGRAEPVIERGQLTLNPRRAKDRREPVCSQRANTR